MDNEGNSMFRWKKYKDSPVERTLFSMISITEGALYSDHSDLMHLRTILSMVKYGSFN